MVYSVVRDGGSYLLKKETDILARGLDHRGALELLKKMLTIEEMKYKGDAGKDGKDGRDGIDGENGKDGKDGVDGVDGVDGKDGENGVDGKDGKDGVDGKDGKNGKDGIDGRFFVKTGTPEKICSGLIWFDLTDRKLKVCIGNEIITYG